MSDVTEVRNPKSSELPPDLTELVERLSRLPAGQRSEIQEAIARVVESTRRRRRILTLVQDALGQLRLDMKYLMFDLEATRRERDEYRQKFEDRG